MSSARIITGDFVPGYMLAGKIGGGSSGTVYSAVRIQPPENLAIKLIEVPERECGATEQNFSEVCIAAGMICNNIVPITDIVTFSKPSEKTSLLGKKRPRGQESTQNRDTQSGQSDANNSSIYIAFAMPQLFCTLRGYIEYMHSGSKQIISTDVLRYVTKSILEGVCALNYRGMSHFDIKPENVLIGSYGDVRIGDFGLSRTRNWFSSKEDPSYWFVGNTTVITPGYRPVECWMEPKYLSVKADIFSIGCIVLEMIFGRIVFYKSETISEANRDVGPKFESFLWMLLEVLPVPSLDFWTRDGNTYNQGLLHKLGETIERFKRANSVRIDLGTNYDLSPLRNTAERSINSSLPDSEVKAANVKLYKDASVLGISPVNILNRVLKQYGEQCLEFIVSCLAHRVRDRPTSQEALTFPWITNSTRQYDNPTIRQEFAASISRMNVNKKKKNSNPSTDEHPHLTCPTTIQSINPPSYPGNQQIVNVPHQYDGKKLQFTNVDSISAHCI